MIDKTVKIVSTLGAVLMLSGCSTMGQVFNPFYEAPSEVAYLGEKNDHALQDGSGQKADRARAAFEAAGNYQRALPPQPVNPVIQPSVVRLMWIPDHLNSHGDLVPAHYYYVKVLKDRWAVSDAFELEGQLGASTQGSNIGYALPEDVK